MNVECNACHARYDVRGRPAGSELLCRCGEATVVPKAPKSAGVLLCPVCGAPASPDRTRCTHCETALALVGCPRCLGRVFSGSAHCSHCGADLALAAKALPSEESQRLCPRCPGHAPKRLVTRVVDTVVLDECHACGGVWVDSVAFDRLVVDRQKQALVLEAGGVRRGLSPGNPAASGPLRYLPCPDCGELMHRKNFGQRSGVIIDVCRPHGLWFDRDELGRAVNFALSGGLEASRRRELEELERRIEKRKEGLLTDAPSMTSSGWGARVGELGGETMFEVLFDVLLSPFD